MFERSNTNLKTEETIILNERPVRLYVQEHCETYYRCWGCQHFLLRKEEIEEAIEKLAKYTINHKSLMENSKNFSYDNPIAADSIKKIALIQKRIMDLGIPSEKVWEMVKNKMQGKDIKEALKNV